MGYHICVFIQFSRARGVFFSSDSTDSFLMVQIQTDRTEQLEAASQQMSAWDCKEIFQWAGKNGIEWDLVLTGG